MTMPLVTVYITAYNREDLIFRAINSVVNQTYRNLEIIVVDDSSTDKTVDIVNSVIKSNPKLNIRLFVNETNRGACYSRNVAIKLAKGKFITGLDDDDAFDKGRIKYFVDNYSEKFAFYATPMKVKSKCFTYLSQKKTGIVTKKDIKSFNCIGNQIFIKTQRLIEVGGFDEEFPAWQDYELFFRLIMNFGAAYKLKKPTYIHYTDHEYGRITNSTKIESAHGLFLKKHFAVLSKANVQSLLFTKLLTQRKKAPHGLLVSRILRLDLRVFKYLLKRVI